MVKNKQLTSADASVRGAGRGINVLPAPAQWLLGLLYFGARTYHRVLTLDGAGSVSGV